MSSKQTAAARQVRKWTKDEIKAHLIPAFIALDFEVIPLTHEDKISEIGTSYPFGQMRRQSDPFIDILEIQIDRHLSCSFRISAARISNNGIDNANFGHIPAEDVWTGYTSNFFSFLSSPFFGIWFSAWRPWRRTPSREDVRRYVARVTKIVTQEIEDALRHGKRGPHTRHVVGN